jgi:hypothetical protein
MWSAKKSTPKGTVNDINLQFISMVNYKSYGIQVFIFILDCKASFHLLESLLLNNGIFNDPPYIKTLSNTAVTPNKKSDDGH